MSKSGTATGIIVLGNQLFPVAGWTSYAGCPVLMSEDRDLCARYRYHQQKLVLVLSAMREYADELRKRGFVVTYHRFDDTSARSTYKARLTAFAKANSLTTISHYEVEDHGFDTAFAGFCKAARLRQDTRDTPMFLTSRPQFAAYLDGVKRPFMAEFYKQQRQRLNILVDEADQPDGGQWSFDTENRRKLPRAVTPPPLPGPKQRPHVSDVIKVVEKHFPNNPGRAADFWWPATRRDALQWLRRFVDERLDLFGNYQDAITQRSETAFHSVLTPILNIGLVTPADVTGHVLAAARERDLPMNSVEGFVRQVIGWREFMRGIYHHYDDQQRDANFFNHERTLGDAWYTGDTGIPPLDDAIRSALRLGWTHHINRLMVIANMMNLCEIQPRQVHDWFMETHVDAYEWVMGPNVYGMGLYSDGGVFATKPYLCGSNYLLKMSDYAKGDWCDVVDGLYWRFVARHRGFFAGSPRLSMMAKMLDKQAPARLEHIFAAAEHFVERFTTR